MSKITPQSLKDLQFFAEQFGNQVDFDTFLQEIINTQESQLSGLIGAATFDSVVPVVAERVKLAATYLSAVELFRRRINRLSGNADEQTAIIIKTLQTAKKEYQADANAVIELLASPAPESSLSEGFSSGVVESSPFGEIV